MPARPTILVTVAIVAGLLLSGCDSSGGSGGSGAGTAGTAVPDNLAQALDPEAAARLRSRVASALAGVIPNPGSARYSNLRSGAGGAICGEVEAGSESALHPFLVTPDGAAIVSRSPAVRLEDPDDPFPDLYLEYCATVEELRRLGARMNSLGPAAVPTPETGPLPAPDAGELSVDEAPPPGEAEAPRRGDDESFFNAVVRAPRSAAPRR